MKLYLFIALILTGMISQELKSSTFQETVVLKSIFTDTSVDTTLYKAMLNKGAHYTQNMKSFLLAYYLFMRKPEKNRGKYISAFPEDYDSIMHFVYERIELEEMSPNFLFSFNIIGNAALSKDFNAAKKVVRIFLNSDGVVADLMSGYLVSLLKQNTDIIYDEIATFCEKDIRKISFILKCLNPEEKELIKKHILERKKLLCKNLDILMQKF